MLSTVAKKCFSVECLFLRSLKTKKQKGIRQCTRKVHVSNKYFKLTKVIVNSLIKIFCHPFNIMCLNIFKIQSLLKERGIKCNKSLLFCISFTFTSKISSFHMQSTSCHTWKRQQQQSLLQFFSFMLYCWYYSVRDLLESVNEFEN